MKNFKRFGAMVACAAVLSSCAMSVETGGNSKSPGCTIDVGCVKLAWDPVTTDTAGNPITVDGYKIYYGTSSHSYTKNVYAGNKTEGVVDGLAPGLYYFAVTAYLGLDESGYSNEVDTSGLVAPARSEIVGSEFSIVIPARAQ